MKEKTVHSYELELKRMIRERTGRKAETWLNPQIHATASNMAMLDKIFNEIQATDLTSIVTGSMSQQKTEVTPLLPYYDKINRTLLDQLQALGLNYNITPRKVTENTKQANNDMKHNFLNIGIHLKFLQRYAFFRSLPNKTSVTSDKHLESSNLSIYFCIKG